MASLPPSSSPSSPLHYDAAQTALLLLDFHQFVIDRCEAAGEAAFVEAVKLRNWALEKNVMIVHSLVDINVTPATTCKASERIQGMLASVKAQDDGKGALVPNELRPSSKNLHEMVVPKHPGVVSALKSIDANGTLARREIKSLIIAGLATSGAVLSTVLPATDSGFVVTVARDACADLRAGVHDTLMDSIFPSRAHVVGTEEVLGWFKE